jgi:hypothetical protein
LQTLGVGLLIYWIFGCLFVFTRHWDQEPRGSGRPWVLVMFAEVYSLAFSAARGDDHHVQAERYASRTLELLRRAIALGYKDAANLKKDGDFEGLRQWVDFQQLVNDLEKANEATKPQLP